MEDAAGDIAIDTKLAAAELTVRVAVELKVVD